MPEILTTLVFDLDGTLYRNAALDRETNRVAIAYLADSMGVGADVAADLLAETRVRLAAATGCETTLSRACRELGGDLAELHRRLAHGVHPERFLVRDERVVALVRSLATRFSLHVYTNNNRHLATTILALLGIGQFFGELFPIEYTWVAKPDRRTLEQLLAAIGRRPGECLFVGDRYDIDLRLPAETGCRVRLVAGIDDLLALKKLMVGDDA
jgi:putative hydrolase of the HAD superfamily